ncbi:MAG: hypothetical protein IJ396_00935 [Oscillibacter sp.]|nr:hypothetical protein [Oscillibacter sp.]
MNEKKSFVLYFDAMRLFFMLPVEQRGWLITAIIFFAAEVAEDASVKWEEVAERFPELDENSRFVMQFMCGTIARDTIKWHSQREARLRRQEEKRRQQEGEGI